MVRLVISVTRPRKAHHSQCYGGAPRRFEVSSGSIGLLIHPSNEPTADAWSRHWVRCIEEARDCDALLFVNGEDGQASGALIEVGAALAAGRQVFVVSPDMTFCYHPNCRNF